MARKTNPADSHAPTDAQRKAFREWLATQDDPAAALKSVQMLMSGCSSIEEVRRLDRIATAKAKTEQEARSARQKAAWRRKKSAPVQKQTDELEKNDKINQMPDADAADHGGYGAIALTDLIGDIGLGPICDVTE